MSDKDIHYNRVVYDSFIDFTETLRAGTFIQNPYDLVSIHFEQGPGSHIILHILYLRKDTWEGSTIPPWDKDNEKRLPYR